MIETKGLSVGYENRIILEKVNVSLQKGKLTALIGVNGSGKTTLLKTAASMITPLDGKIEIDGEDVSRLSQQKIAKKLAYLPQSRNIPHMTAGELVLCGRFAHLSFPRVYSEKDKAVAAEAMERMGISHFSHTPLSSLAGGERQNVYVAMALAQGSDYILLDEPTTYLDVAHKIELMKTLKSLAENGKGVVAVLHDLSLALEFADEIAVIHGGNITQYSSPRELLKSGALQEAFGVRIVCTETDGGNTYGFIKD